MRTAPEKVQQTIVWQSALLSDLTKQAQRLDRSLSWCAQRAWMIARAEMSKLDATSKHPKAQSTLDTRYVSGGVGKQQKQVLYFPVEMVAEMKAAAERQDRSISWLMQHAWCFAVSEIEKTPAS